MKKIIALVLSTVMALSICCMPVFAEDDIPSDLPAGSYKVSEGIYIIPLTPITRADTGFISVSIPARSTIYPSSLSNFKVTSGHKYVLAQEESLSGMTTINFQSGNVIYLHGDGINSSIPDTWPVLQPTPHAVAIEAAYFGMTPDKTFQVLLYNGSSGTSTGKVRIWSGNTRP